MAAGWLADNPKSQDMEDRKEVNDSDDEGWQKSVGSGQNVQASKQERVITSNMSADQGDPSQRDFWRGYRRGVRERGAGGRETAMKKENCWRLGDAAGLDKGGRSHGVEERRLRTYSGVEKRRVPFSANRIDRIGQGSRSNRSSGQVEAGALRGLLHGFGRREVGRGGGIERESKQNQAEVRSTGGDGASSGPSGTC
ncbi:hypothetical protein BKA81DRAFT_398113 [Phyllosticta paracitricarpa]